MLGNKTIMFVCLTCAIPEGYQGGYISHVCGLVDAPKLRKKPTGGRPEKCRIYDESGHETELQSIAGGYSNCMGTALPWHSGPSAQHDLCYDCRAGAV